MMDSSVKGPVILVEDEIDVREAAKLTLELDGYEVHAYSRASKALEALSPSFTGVVISDVRMPGLDGFGLLQRISEIDIELPVILVTGHGDIAMALEAMRAGAYDFIEKPVMPDKLLDEVKRALQARALVLENRALRQQLAADKGSLDSVVLGNSVVMQQLKQLLLNIADAGVDVLIHGETGVGKELIASSLHRFSNRSNGNFVALNCGALPESIIESELFGHEAGAFTGASKRRIGKIEYASGGTLFLDELESMPLHLQIKLLRVLQERKLERLGANSPIDVDLRVVAATKKDLLAMAKNDEFREDLFFRLNVAELHIPALRQRGDDILLLFQFFVNGSSERFNRPVPTLTAEQRAILIEYPWPGNVRELQHEAERFVLGISQRLQRVSVDSIAEPSMEGSLPEQLEAFERQLLCQTLQKTSGRVLEAANLLGIPRKKLYLRMQKFSIEKLDFTAKD